MRNIKLFTRQTYQNNRCVSRNPEDKECMEKCISRPDTKELTTKTHIQQSFPLKLKEE
jgi:hypothetical protein